MVVVTRTGRLREWSQRELRMYFAVFSCGTNFFSINHFSIVKVKSSLFLLWTTWHARKITFLAFPGAKSGMYNYWPIRRQSKCSLKLRMTLRCNRIVWIPRLITILNHISILEPSARSYIEPRGGLNMTWRYIITVCIVALSGLL